MKHFQEEVTRLPAALRQAYHQEDWFEQANDGDTAENVGFSSWIIFTNLLINLIDPFIDLLIVFGLTIDLLLHVTDFGYCGFSCLLLFIFDFFFDFLVLILLHSESLTKKVVVQNPVDHSPLTSEQGIL